MIASASAGFLLGLGLILAIGAQNAFVLRQGLLRRHVGLVVAICTLSDVILIAAGVAGAGALVQRVPGLDLWMRLAGAAFLLWYGFRAFAAALRGGEALQAGPEQASWRSVALTALALTWLNPHVYLDTLVLVGAVAQQSPVPWAFGAGASASSVVFFALLGYGARRVAPLFARPSAWRVLDGLVGATMWGIAIRLLWGVWAVG